MGQVDSRNYNLENVAAEVHRGNSVESYHSASIAVVNADGKITHSFGDPHLVTFSRSSLKPIQTLALISSGAAEKYGLSQKEIAICCGSHNGSDEHRETALSILAKAGNDAEMLQCGTHWPTGMRMKKKFPLAGEDGDPTRNNCSGKHSGFLALAKFLGDEPKDYLARDSKTQTAIRKELSEICEIDADAAPYGIDGCSAPNYALDISKLAYGFLKIAQATDGHRFVVAEAIRAHPEMISGEGRFDLALAQAFPNNVINKVGAEAVQVIAFREPALAIVVKVHDGSTRALYAICIETMRQLDLLDDGAMTHLEKFDKPKIKNHRKIITGEILPVFELKVL